jgi:hypothetical protein
VVKKLGGQEAVDMYIANIEINKEINEVAIKNLKSKGKLPPHFTRVLP